MVDSRENKIKELAKDTLDNKWSKIDDLYLELNSTCSFCIDSKWNCEICLCPSEICSDKGEKGYIKYLKKKFGENCKISEISKEDEYSVMIVCLNELIEEGSLISNKELIDKIIEK